MIDRDGAARHQLQGSRPRGAARHRHRLVDADGACHGGMAEREVRRGNGIQVGAGQAEFANRLAAEIDFTVRRLRAQGHRSAACRAAVGHAALQIHVIGLQQQCLPHRRADDLSAAAIEADASVEFVGAQFRIAAADIQAARHAEDDIGARQRNPAALAGEGRIDMQDSRAALCRGAAIVVGRQSQRAAIGGNGLVDVDAVASLRRESHAGLGDGDGCVEVDVVLRLQHHIAGGRRNQAGADSGRARRRRSRKIIDAAQRAAIAGDHVDVIRIEQPVARLPARRAGARIDPGAVDGQVMARRFHQPAVARSTAAARRNAAEHARRLVAPHDDLAAVAALNRVGDDGGVLADGDLARIGNRRVLALIVAAQQHRTAARGAAGVHFGVALHADLVAQHGNLATLAHRTGGAGDAAVFQQRLAAGFQHDLAVLSHHRAIGVEHATLVQQRADHADAPALRHDLAHIDGLIRGGRQHHAQVRVGGVGQLHAVAGGQQHVAVRRGDDAAVFHVRRDQQNLPAAAGMDGSLVDDGAGLLAGIEIHLASQEILVRQRQAGRHQPRHVDPRIAAEQHAVRIDQENFAVRLQGAEDLAGVLPRNAVEHAAAGVLLEKARDFARIDGKALPVDDGIGRIGDRKQIALLVEGGLAMHHLRQDRIGVGGVETGGNQERQRGAAQRRLDRAASRHAAQWFLFGHGVLSLGLSTSVRQRNSEMQAVGVAAPRLAGVDHMRIVQLQVGVAVQQDAQAQAG